MKLSKSIDMKLKKMFLCLCVVLFTSFSVQSERKVFVQKVVEEKPLSIDYDQVCLIESCGRDSITSTEGAIGAMQITLLTLKEWNNTHLKEKYFKKDLLNKKINIKIGTWLLSERIPFYFINSNIPDKLTYRLIAYNWGVNNFIKWYKHGHHYYKLPQETKDYLVKYWDKY